MGRSYWFECVKCGYRAKVSGRSDRGINLFVQTIVCHDCKELYDAVLRIRLPDDSRFEATNYLPGQFSAMSDKLRHPPSFVAASNLLQTSGAGKFKWVRFAAQCPVAAYHRVKPWNDPDKCPRCGVFLEKNTLPYRIWE